MKIKDKLSEQNLEEVHMNLHRVNTATLSSSWFLVDISSQLSISLTILKIQGLN